MLDTMLGKSQTSRQSPIFFRRPPDRKSYFGCNNSPDLAVRDGKWKLMCDYDGTRPMLHDLEVDPGEKNNLASAHPTVVTRLTDQVVAWHRSLPPDNGPMLGNP